MICTEIDDWLQDQMDTGYKAIWQVRLSDDTVVYQDDGRDESADSAWIRLKRHCEDNNLKITSMALKFRSNVINLPSGKDGYYFIRGFLGSFGYRHPKRHLSGFETAIVGFLEDGVIKTETYRCPELLKIDIGQRSIEDNLDCLIGEY